MPTGTMLFLKQNFIDTIGSIFADSGSGTLQYLFDRNINLGYTSIGYDSNTATVISIEFSEPKVVSTVFLQEHNLKQFRVFYNSATANTFTPDINETTNSDTSNYFKVNSQTVNSIQIQLDNTIAGGVEKEIGEFTATEQLLEFERNPSARNYKPLTKNVRVKRNMPDGGVNTFKTGKKFRTQLKWKFVTDSFTSDLLDIYEDAKPIYFIPFATSTTWDGAAFETQWTNDFDFTFDENSKTQGQGGSILLEETPSA